MDVYQNNLNPFCDSVMDALKRAYEECPNSKTRSFILIAFNAIIRLETEIKKGNTSIKANPRHVF